MAAPGGKTIIAVMGLTGMGKSTFIQIAGGFKNIEVGNGFHSCTAEVAAYSFKLGNHEVELIDTPGFNDTNKDEATVLREIADWLAEAYRRDIEINGIVYLQMLTERRMGHSSVRNLQMFRKLCGQDPLRNVVLVTTGWEDVIKTKSLDAAEAKEAELLTDPDFWEPLVRRGSRPARFMQSRESALAIINMLRDSEAVPLQVQQEIVEEGRAPIDTSAGQYVNEEIERLKAKYSADLAAVQKDMAQALDERDVTWLGALEESKRTFERKLDHAREQQSRLEADRRKMNRVFTEQLSQAVSGAKLREEQLEQRQAEMLRNHEMEKKAQRMEDEMRFEGIVRQIRENEQRLNAQQRAELERRIYELEAKPKKSGRGKDLLVGMVPFLGTTLMGLLGFPGLLGS